MGSSLPKSLITVFIPSFRGGGAERAMILFANEIATRNYLVDLLVLKAEGPLTSLVSKDVRIKPLNSNRAILSLPSLISYLVKNKPFAMFSTIIHINLISILAKKISFSKTKIVVRESNTPKAAFSHSRSGRLSLSLLPWIYPLSHAIIAVSEGVKNSLNEISNKMDSKIKIIPTPVVSDELLELANVPLQHEYLPENKKIKFNSPFILGVGRLHFQKDFVTLIKAFNELKEQHPKLSLVILGEGGERNVLENLIAKLNIQDRVHLLGFIENPFPFFKNASAFILSSKFEGMPNVLIQALAIGTPSVSTDCESGPNEISENGKLCTLVPVGDHLKMAGAISNTIEMGANPKAAVAMTEKFGITNCVDKYLSLVI